MVGRKDAVAVGKEQVGGVARTGALVTATRQAKAVVFVRGKCHSEIDLSGELVHHVSRAVGRSVVGYHHFELPSHSPLVS
jgi:hypothetical protein